MQTFSKSLQIVCTVTILNDRRISDGQRGIINPHRCHWRALHFHSFPNLGNVFFTVKINFSRCTQYNE